MSQPKTFADLGVHDDLVAALPDNITHPFAIQELTLPMALKGSDIIGQARTGTGKTLAFGLALLHRLDPDRAATQALIVVPTRELCLQVTEDLEIGAARNLSVVAVYGGVGYDEQIEALAGGVHVVVGTPGRLLDLLGRGTLDLSQASTLVLDEADEMLDMGFLPDVERLIEACPDDRHTMLFSATMPTAVVKLARRYMTHPTFMRASVEEHEVAPNVDQHFFVVHRMDKPRVLARLLQTPDRGSCYVFVRTKNMADRLVSELEDLSVAAVAVHGNLRQQTRERNMERFRSGKVNVLVATEVAARGLDVDNVSHVVNYDCPDDEKMYLHRIGRTARAGNAGVAVTLAQFNEVDRLNVIRKAVGATDQAVEEVFSTSPRLRELFGLPEQTPWGHFGTRSSSRPKGRGKGRSGSSDGKPKSTRSAEGRGERSRNNGRPRDGARAGGRDGARGGRQRARARSRDQASPSGDHHGPARSNDREPEAHAPSSTRRRTPTNAGEDSPRTRTRARTRARTSEPAPRKRAPAAKSHPDERTDKAPAARSRTDDAADGAPVDTVRPAAAGDEARGDGDPQLARRVKVEHLP